MANEWVHHSPALLCCLQRHRKADDSGAEAMPRRRWKQTELTRPDCRAPQQERHTPHVRTHGSTLPLVNVNFRTCAATDHSQGGKIQEERESPPLENSGKQGLFKTPDLSASTWLREITRNMPNPSTTAQPQSQYPRGSPGSVPTHIKRWTLEPSWRLDHLEWERAIGTLTKC